jgi:hypothetical protein
MCIINRAGAYILLAININLAALCADLYLAVSRGNGHMNKNALNVLTTVFPFLLMIIAYMVENSDRDTENVQLNLARHAFSCSMRFCHAVLVYPRFFCFTLFSCTCRFPDMETEWALLW